MAAAFASACASDFEFVVVSAGGALIAAWLSSWTYLDQACLRSWRRSDSHELSLHKASSSRTAVGAKVFVSA